MQRTEISINKTKHVCELPTNWGECTQDMLATICKHIYGRMFLGLLAQTKQTDNTLTPEEVKQFNQIKLFYDLSGFDGKVTEQLTTQEAIQISNCLAFVHTEPPTNTALISQWKMPNHTFELCGFGFSNVVFAQYIFIDAYARAFNNDASIENLNKLASSLVVEEQPFFPAQIDKQLAKVSPLLPEIKLAWWKAYQVNMQAFAALYPLMFDTNKAGDKPTGFGMYGLTVSLGGGPFGTTEEVKQTLVNEVFMHLEMEAQRVKK